MIIMFLIPLVNYKILFLKLKICFLNMVRPSSQIFIYPADGKGAFAPIANGLKLDCLIGSTLAGLMNLSDDYTSGLQLVRLRFGSSTIVAHKRLRDIKVTLTTYHHV